jgi:hypothetical protein
MSMGSVRSVRMESQPDSDSEGGWHTVDFTLVTLVADSANQLGYTLLPVEPDGDRLFMVTEQARKRILYSMASELAKIRHRHTDQVVLVFLLDRLFATTFCVCPSCAEDDCESVIYLFIYCRARDPTRLLLLTSPRWPLDALHSHGLAPTPQCRLRSSQWRDHVQSCPNQHPRRATINPNRFRHQLCDNRMHNRTTLRPISRS